MKKLMYALLLACCVNSAVAETQKATPVKATQAIEKQEGGILKKAAVALKNHPWIAGNAVGLTAAAVAAAAVEKENLLAAALCYAVLTPCIHYIASNLPVESDEEKAVRLVMESLSSSTIKTTTELAEIKELLVQLHKAQIEAASAA